MQRVTVSLDDALATGFDELSKARGYHSRSEAVRDVLRDVVGAHQVQSPAGHCVANLSYVYNHHERAMAARLMDMQHAHHEIVLTTAHVHLDHDHCLETMMLSGEAGRIRHFADALQAERGIRNAVLNLIPVERGQSHHKDGHGAADHRHHLSPR